MHVQQNCYTCCSATASLRDNIIILCHDDRCVECDCYSLVWRQASCQPRILCGKLPDRKYHTHSNLTPSQLQMIIIEQVHIQLAMLHYYSVHTYCLESGTYMYRSPLPAIYNIIVYLILQWIFNSIN